MQTPILTVGQLNRALDALCAANDRDEKRNVLKDLLSRTTAREQKWIVRIVTKELKLSTSEKTFLGQLHRDAEEYFNITSNLEKVCQTLIDPAIRLPRTLGIQLFHPIKPMLAARLNPDAVAGAMHGAFGIETKFDGERIQVHKSGATIRLFTRNANEYTEKYASVLPTLRRHLRSAVESCIMDGELLVWDSKKNQFEPFGHIKSYAKYQNRRDERRGSGDQDDDCDDDDDLGSLEEQEPLMTGKQYCYVAFDLVRAAVCCAMKRLIRVDSCLSMAKM